jgi:hypothetical protein
MARSSWPACPARNIASTHTPAFAGVQLPLRRRHLRLLRVPGPSQGDGASGRGHSAAIAYGSGMGAAKRAHGGRYLLPAVHRGRQRRPVSLRRLLPARRPSAAGDVPAASTTQFNSAPGRVGRLSSATGPTRGSPANTADLITRSAIGFAGDCFLRLSAWESDRITPLEVLTWQYDCPLLTFAEPCSPGLMAHQWPGDLELLTVRIFPVPEESPLWPMERRPPGFLITWSVAHDVDMATAQPGRPDSRIAPRRPGAGHSVQHWPGR